jgi:hypothetical protein
METPTLLDLLDRANLIHWTLTEPNRVRASLPSHGDVNRPSFRNVVFSRYLEFRTLEKVYETLIFSVIHYRQNPLAIFYSFSYYFAIIFAHFSLISFLT